MESTHASWQLSGIWSPEPAGIYPFDMGPLSIFLPIGLYGKIPLYLFHRSN
jgi:hypothetical protein